MQRHILWLANQALRAPMTLACVRLADSLSMRMKGVLVFGWGNRQVAG